MNVFCQSCKKNIANINPCVSNLDRIHFPFQRRKDSDIPELQDVKKIKCKYKKLKYCICALRRKKIQYWYLFDEIVSNNIDELCTTLNARWIVSICDTYIDYGSDEEKCGSIAVSTLNFCFTLNNSIYHSKEKINPKSNIIGKICSVPYDTSFMFKNENDFFENYLKRFIYLIKRSDKIYRFGMAFLQRQIKDKNTLFFYVNSLNEKKFKIDEQISNS
jgi:hypothetical protein